MQEISKYTVFNIREYLGDGQADYRKCKISNPAGGGAVPHEYRKPPGSRFQKLIAWQTITISVDGKILEN